MITYCANPNTIDWESLRTTLIEDEFHNGRTSDQLRLSFENSQMQVYAMDDDRCIGTARALSDGVGNAYVIDVWTLSGYRGRGIATSMMQKIMEACPGQHIYLQTDDAVGFYEKLGFSRQPEGLSKVIGRYLDNHSLLSES